MTGTTRPPMTETLSPLERELLGYVETLMNTLQSGGAVYHPGQGTDRKRLWQGRHRQHSRLLRHYPHFRPWPRRIRNRQLGRERPWRSNSVNPHQAISRETRREPQDLDRRATAEAHYRRSDPGNEDGQNAAADGLETASAR